MRILMVTPRNAPTLWTADRALSIIQKRCLFPNLSMPTLAGLTPREHEVILCDENVEDVDFDVEADVVAVTGYIVHRERMLYLIEEFRSRGRFVAVGGPYASLCPEELRGHCDALFVGEAEETWPRFLRDFELGRPEVEYREGEKPDLTQAPPPRFDLLKMDLYEAATIQTGRGCPFRCEFCDIIVVYGRRPRIKTVEQVLGEVRECHRLGARRIFIADDNFIGNKNHAKLLLRALGTWGRENGYPIAFGTEASVNAAEDDELLELMRQANLTTIFMGIESPRAASLQETKKTQNVRGDMIAQIHKVHAFGIQVQAGMIVGFDSDDAAVFDEHVRFLEDARVPVAIVSMLQALPRTPLYQRIQAEGRLLTEASSHHSMGFSNIEPAGMTRLELYRGYRALLVELYSIETFGVRVRGYLWNRGAQVERRRTYTFDEWRKALVPFFTELARAPRDVAWSSARLLLETLWRRPDAFREAASFVLVNWSQAEYVRSLLPQLDAIIELLEKESSEELPRRATA
jgi:radical SAM superfamily enzyme YgiQ (UPF0313 family)